MARPFWLCELSSIFSKLGIKPQAPREAKSGMYKIRTSGKNKVRKVYDYLYKDATIYLKRKYDKFAVLGRDT
jgi:hypothetical protein